MIKTATDQRFLGRGLTMKFESQHITLKKGTAQRITQHKRFVPSGTYPNFCFAKTSQTHKMLGTMQNKRKLPK
jgi:hypothetical protein